MRTLKSRPDQLCVRSEPDAQEGFTAGRGSIYPEFIPISANTTSTNCRSMRDDRHYGHHLVLRVVQAVMVMRRNLNQAVLCLVQSVRLLAINRVIRRFLNRSNRLD